MARKSASEKEAARSVSVADVPTELLKDILRLYASNFAILQGHNKNDNNSLMSKFASEWEKDRCYPGFAMSRISGNFYLRSF